MEIIIKIVTNNNRVYFIKHSINYNANGEGIEFLDYRNREESFLYHSQISLITLCNAIEAENTRFIKTE